MNDFYNINTYLKNKQNEFSVCNYNEADALVLAQLSYYPFENFYQKDRKVSVPELARKIMEGPDFYSYSKDKQTFIKELMNCKRYARCIIHNMQSVSTPDTRWAAFTMDFRTGNTSAIAMRGTDKTTVGWAEDFRLGYNVMGTGAQLASFRYLKETKARKIYLTGHSKGGNNVSSAFAMSAPNIRDKIIRIDNFDGPGVNPEFAHNYSDGYGELEGKLHNFYPEGSVIGLLLKDNPGEINFIKTQKREGYRNNMLLGQHNPFAWEIRDGFLVRTKQSCASELLNHALDELMNITDSKQRYYLVQIIERMGIPAIISGEVHGVAAILTTAVCGYFEASREEKTALFYALVAFIKGFISQSKEWIAKPRTKEYNRIELL